MTQKRTEEIIANIKTSPSAEPIVVFIDDLKIMPDWHIEISFIEEFMELYHHGGAL